LAASRRGFEPPGGPHPNLDRVGLKLAVLRLAGVSRHRDGLGVNILHLIDGARLGQGLTGNFSFGLHLRLPTHTA
jgi:hypothetical protein